jgi:hypothetical protein
MITIIISELWRYIENKPNIPTILCQIPHMLDTPISLRYNTAFIIF